MNIAAERNENWLEVKLEGNFAANESKEFQRHFESIVADEEIKGIIINCEKVLYIDSSGLNLFVTIFKKLEEQNRKLVICNANDRVLELFRLTRLDKILEIADDEKSAKRLISS